MSSRERKRFGLRCRNFDSDDGVDFARGRICGDHRRVISGRHLSKHDTDRETYMDEYHFSPDELIVKDFNTQFSLWLLPPRQERLDCCDERVL